MTRLYRPSFRSFLGCIAYSLSMALVAGIVLFMTRPHPGVLIWIGSILMLLFSFALCVQDVVVHLIQLEISSLGIRTFGGITPARAMLWSEITEALLRERHNPVSRTDRLIILKSHRGMMNYSLSVLSRSDEQEALEELNRRTRLVVMQDRRQSSRSLHHPAVSCTSAAGVLQCSLRWIPLTASRSVMWASRIPARRRRKQQRTGPLLHPVGVSVARRRCDWRCSRLMQFSSIERIPNSLTT